MNEHVNQPLKTIPIETGLDMLTPALRGYNDTLSLSIWNKMLLLIGE